MTEMLSDFLSAYKAATLASMVSFNGLSPRYQKGKDAYLHALVEMYGDSTHIQETYKALFPAEHEVVDTILRHNGKMSTFAIAQRLTFCKLIDVSPRSKVSYQNGQPDLHRPNSRRLEEIMARLQAWGLVFGVPDRNVYGQELSLDLNLVQEYAIPEDIRAALPQPAPLPARKVPEVPAPERIVEGSARTFQRDLYFYWSFVRASPIQLTAKGMILKRQLTALNETLLVRETIGTGQVEGDFPRLVFIRSILMGLKGLGSVPGGLEAQPDPLFFSRQPVERIKACFDEYVTGRTVNELHSIVNYVSNPESTPALPTPELVIEARKTVLQFLKQAAHWIQIDRFTQHIREDAYEFLFKRSYRGVENRTYYSYGYATHPYSMYTNPLHWDFTGVTNDGDGWDKVEARFIRCILEGALSWMGLIDLGYSRPDLPQADVFRLTAMGAWLLAGGKPPEIDLSGGRVILQPNYQITAFDPISDDVLLNLERFAERISADRAVELRLTQSSVYNAQRQGWDDLRIQEYLEQVTGLPVPENVKRTLKDWQMQHERITIYPHVSLLHGTAPADLDAFEQDAQLKGWVDLRPAPDLMLIRERNSIPKLVHALVAKSWLPVVVPSDQKHLVKSIDIESDGTLRISTSSQDLFLHGRLAGFADRTGGSEYHLTAASVQRAVRNGMPAREILNELAQIAIGEMPLELEKRILAWSGHYGTASLEETILLQMQSAATLKELAEDPEIGPLLHPIDTTRAQTMATVRPKDLARLNRLLDERGIRH